MSYVVCVEDQDTAASLLILGPFRKRASAVAFAGRVNARIERVNETGEVRAWIQNIHRPTITAVRETGMLDAPDREGRWEW